ncbi:hypothetical protein HPB51_004309 [Rhipicephalus microplus]|uniref:BBS2 platform domain-containing protein n=1 Tax=Rhipicephalus microplus TaxID=6941 RepID=A0A9J6ELR0_RHIMP|nr:hypothetical protein HPB51_004309 [Rhipicephalus microplus]
MRRPLTKTVCPGAAERRKVVASAMASLCGRLSLECAKERSAKTLRPTIVHMSPQVASWVNQNFLLAEELQYQDSFRVSFLALRCLKPITIDVQTSGEVSIETGLMDVAADMVQSLAAYLEIEDLESRAHFPDEYERLGSLVDKGELVPKVNEAQQSRRSKGGSPREPLPRAPSFSSSSRALAVRRSTGSMQGRLVHCGWLRRS